MAVESQGTANTRYNVIFRDVDGANIYGGIATKTGQVGFWGVGVSPAATLGSRLNVNGNVAIGNGYTGTAAPSNGMIVQGSVGIGLTSPGSPLHVDGNIEITANDKIKVDGNSTNSVELYNGSSGAMKLTAGDSTYDYGMEFHQNNVQVMTIKT